jgi:uncharacterized protein
MDRVRQIITDVEYQLNLKKTKQAEANRLFCRHDYHHALSVARLSYLIALEEGKSELSKSVIYAAALLHDIGRWVEYANGEDHCEAGARLAIIILQRVGFSEDEQTIILAGIKEHRNPITSALGHILALADDLSRDCYRCSVISNCYKAEKMQKLHQQLIL